jgi:hypothetical protein
VVRLACLLSAVAVARPAVVPAENPPPAPAAAPVPGAAAAPAQAPAAPAPPPAKAPAPVPPAPTPAPGATTSTVKAARLALVGRTREHLIYIDKPTLRKLTTDRFELWAEVHSDSGERVKFLMQLNCAERSYLVKSEVVYAADGDVEQNSTHDRPALQYVVPDSASEFIHEAVCRPS